MDALTNTIDGLNFWERPELVDKLAAKLDDANHSEQLVSEIIALARRREQDILGENR